MSILKVSTIEKCLACMRNCRLRVYFVATALSMWATMCAGSVTAEVSGAPAAKLAYNRDIRPILAENCFRCHGPDANERQGGLRLDTLEGATALTDSGAHAVVTGKPDESELVRRVFSTDESEAMPPADSGKKLSSRQREILKAWIAQGAAYEKHWSFIKPDKPEVPQVEYADWCRNPIDRFVMKRLEEAALKPADEVDRRTLLRRVSLDLTGLPPTIAEVDAFLADKAPDAYERVVDRLLASPRYGERMAADWLDLARYADTDGYEKDSHRQMWPYRDWLIAAFNENMPFDRFTIEQLAGDMLPGATQAQKIASAFNRNGPTTSESGSDPEEYAVKYAVDRLTTTSTVWLGLTMQCAECHDHKFDPLTARDFYSFMAFFDQVPETPLYEGADSPPSIPAFSAEQQSKAADLEQRLASAKKTLVSRESELAAQQSKWEATNGQHVVASREGLIAEYLFDGSPQESLRDSSGAGAFGRIATLGAADAGVPGIVAAPAGQAYEFAGNGFIECGPLRVNVEQGFSYGAWVKPTARGGVLLSCTDPHLAGRGFDVYLQAGVAMVHITDSWPAAAVKLTTQSKYQTDQWQHVLVTCSGGEGPSAIRIYFNGVRQPTQTDVQGGPLKTVSSSAPLRIGSRAAGESAMYGAIDDVRIYNRALSDTEAADAARAYVMKLLQIPESGRTEQQILAIANFYRSSVIEPAVAGLRGEVANYQQQYDKLRAGVPMVRIMADVAERRPTYIRIRGDYRSTGDEVTPDIPTELGALSELEPHNRLALAKWLVGSENPLTARVMVNRLWAMCFGAGIVNTMDDFGSRGEWPSHPDLLDWLAVEFRKCGWDMKHMLRLMVTSSTYCQGSVRTAASAEPDPDNRLLSRRSRRRMPAEMIRDSALLVSGLLHEQLGGPSVFPYHPPGLWEEMAWAEAPHKTWIQDHGRNLYRRGLYTFWKRSLVHPVFSVFDAPTRNTCAFARPTTNTPLQSLVGLNEPSFIEAARGLAGRTIAECDGKVPDRIKHMYLLALSRPPEPQESTALHVLLEKALRKFETDEDAAQRYISIGDLSKPDGIDAAQYAAWTVVAQTVLNLDEAVTTE